MGLKKRRIFFETEEVIRKTKRGYIDLDMDYFQFYNVAFRYIASLSNSCSKDFILWIMSRVDEKNEFLYNKTVYEDFIKSLAEINKPKIYKENTLHAALAELVKCKVIFRISRGRYKVNPQLFWTGSITSRINEIKYLTTNDVEDIDEKKKLPENTDSEIMIVEENVDTNYTEIL